MRPSTKFWSQRRLAISDSQYHLSLIRRCSYFPYSLACLRFHFESLLQKNTNNLGKIDRKRAIRIISMKLQPFIFDDVYDGPTPWKCTFLEEVQRMEFMFRAKTGFITLLSNTIHVYIFSIPHLFESKICLRWNSKNVSDQDLVRLIRTKAAL